MDYATKSAVISECGDYRYVLGRQWSDGPACMFIGLNPSTADAADDDPTIRRCVRFASDWGYGSLYMLNLFGFRATDPKRLTRVIDPIGAQNDDFLMEYAGRSKIIIAAWGNHGTLLGRDIQVRQTMCDELHHVHHLGLTKVNQPRHPLYLKADTVPSSWGCKQ